jgi:acyl carrier protein phosphodiesterase
MNFLAHFYFDKSEDPHYNLGLILPDLYRNFVKGGRIKESDLDSFSLQDPIAGGSRKHFESDRKFHGSEVFKRGEDSIRAELRTFKGHAFDRDFFIAHILYELILDHCLLRTQRDLASKLYSDFEVLEYQMIHEFIKPFGAERADHFLKGLDQFKSVRYLEQYHAEETIVFSLGKICNKMNIAPFYEDQKTFLLEMVSGISPIIVEDIVKLEEWLR